MTSALQLELGEPDRLAELGLDVETLHRAVRAGIAARATRTDLAPRNAQGTDLVSHTVEEFRLLTDERGWSADWAGGQERTVSPDGRTAVIVSTGAGAVGDPRGEVRTAHPKGPLMREAVTENLGFVQEEFPLGLRPEPGPASRRLCWVLLVKVEPGRADLELSVPNGMREGVVDSWAERIPLPPLLLAPEADPDDPPGDLDVPVEFKG
ncbi:MAG TPA: hypothetical protein VGP36_06495 [Mycobacteriales bacterium]|nr:hypothetical protein [Mycobacteriales bacterium]